jgi:hypothetical protein
VKLKMVIDAATERDRVAVAVTLVTGTAAKARQISVVPGCPFARTTSTHVKPAPATEFTTVVPDAGPSVEMKASRSSLPAVVEKTGLLMVVLVVDCPVDLLTSMVIPAVAAVVLSSKRTVMIIRWE